MSKYQAIYNVCGGVARWNDKTKTGRVLKWELDTADTPKKERDLIAAEWAAKLKAAGVPFQKVQVRNSVTTDPDMNKMTGYDKLSVYIEAVDGIPPLKEQ